MISRESDLKQAIQLLKDGELVGIPTETVYGLAGHGLNPAAIVKIFEVKNRPFFDPLILHISGAMELEKYAHSIPDDAYKLANKFWPGALTILLPKKDIIPDLVTSALPDAGFRVPNHPLTLALLKELEFPLAAPSANPFGYVSPTSVQHVEEQLGEKIKLILDGGICNVGVESTIIGFGGETPFIFRLGGISIEDLEETLGKKVEYANSSTQQKQAPGMLEQHYSPNIQILLGNIENLLESNKEKKVAVISYSKNFPDTFKNYVLSEQGSLAEAAQNLFAFLRVADKSGAEIILTELVPNVGIGRAINDRLKRASAKRN